MSFRVDRARLDALGPGERGRAEGLLAELQTLREQNPLQFFHPNSQAQQQFFEACTPVVAAFAGNRFGKTTGLVVRSLVECVPAGLLPEHLRSLKRWPGPTFGRIVCPDFTSTAEGVILPAFRRWAPKQALFGGAFDKAWDKQLRMIRFRDGGFIQVMTYEQDLDKFGGSALHFVGYDEPPPRELREECWARLVDFGGYEMFAMTPLKANTGWIRREVWRRREHPDFTVVKGSIHDNRALDEAAKNRFLNGLSSDLWRAAREFGDFVDLGGLIYPDFERCTIDPPDPELVRGWDHVVSIDPGIRNCGVVFLGFDDENTGFVFDELLLQDRTPADYATEIRGVLSRWGVPFDGVLFVIDPAARSRSQVNAESVESELTRFGLFCVPGQNQVEAGVQQVRTRLQHKRLLISKGCRGLRDEADEYAAEDRPDGEFKPIKQNDHRLDALRYGCMARPWWPDVEGDAPDRQLGWSPGFEPAWQPARPASDHPLGRLA